MLPITTLANADTAKTIPSMISPPIDLLKYHIDSLIGRAEIPHAEVQDVFLRARDRHPVAVCLPLHSFVDAAGRSLLFDGEIAETVPVLLGRSNARALHRVVDTEFFRLAVDRIDLSVLLNQHDRLGEIVPHHMKCLNDFLLIHRTAPFPHPVYAQSPSIASIFALSKPST